MYTKSLVSLGIFLAALSTSVQAQEEDFNSWGGWDLASTSSPEVADLDAEFDAEMSKILDQMNALEEKTELNDKEYNEQMSKLTTKLKKLGGEHGIEIEMLENPQFPDPKIEEGVVDIADEKQLKELDDKITSILEDKNLTDKQKDEKISKLLDPEIPESEMIGSLEIDGNNK